MWRRYKKHSNRAEEFVGLQPRPTLKSYCFKRQGRVSPSSTSNHFNEQSANAPVSVSSCDDPTPASTRVYAEPKLPPAPFFPFMAQFKVKGLSIDEVVRKQKEWSTLSAARKQELFDAAADSQRRCKLQKSEYRQVDFYSV